MLRSIEVKLPHAKYDLSYRRAYYALARHAEAATESAPAIESSATLRSDAQNDALQSNMKHGAPMVHDLLFSAHIHADGIPAKASAEQMAELSEQPAYVSTRHKDKPLAPVDLQKYVIDYRVTDLALKAQATQNGKPSSFEFAAAAFDAESRMLNNIVNETTGDVSASSDTSKSGIIRVRQQLDVPAHAAWIRIGVRDKLTNRVGTLEVQLPLAPELPTPVTSAR